jgi:GAF domain-containing protein
LELIMEANNPVRLLQLEVARLTDETRELKEELAVLRSSVRALSAFQDIISRLTPQTDVLVLLDDMLASALAVVGSSDGSLLLLDEESDELVFVVVHGEARERLTGMRLPPGKGIAGWVAQNKRPLIVPDVHSDPRFFSEIDRSVGFQTRTLACVPLMDGERLLGVLNAVNKTYDRAFTDQDHDLLLVVANLATVALRRAEAYATAAEEEAAAS